MSRKNINGRIFLFTGGISRQFLNRVKYQKIQENDYSKIGRSQMLRRLYLIRNERLKYPRPND